MALTPVPPIEPVLPDPPNPLDDETTFDAAAYAWSAALPEFGSDLEAIGSATYANALEAVASATTAATQVDLATTQATNAANSAIAAANSAATNGALWVSGTTYAVGYLVYSPITLLTYRRSIAGAGTTDPSADAVKWAAQVTTVNGVAGAVTGIATTGANTFTAAQELASGASIASASTVDLNAATGNRVHITGSTTITAVTLTRGPRTVIFDNSLTLTHHATNNNLPGGVNITTAAGDRAVYESDGTTVYCVSYVKASGLPVVSPAAGSLIYLMTVTGTNAATIDVEHAFDSTYDEYVLECVDLVAATADSSLKCRMKISGAYDTTTTNYGANVTTAGVNGYENNLSILSGIMTNSVTRPNSFKISIIKPFAALQKRIFWSGLKNTSYSVNEVALVVGAGVHISTAPCTGFRFFMVTGNITSATFHLYGVKKS